MFDLNDLRFFLAVAHTGSLSSAARELGVTQPTVGRRIQAIEKELDARLFKRVSSGYQLTSTGKKILPSAKKIEENAWQITNQVLGEEKNLCGKVRLATSEGLANCWILKRLDGFKSQHPNIQLEVFGGTAKVDMLRREADIALRIGTSGSDELVGKCLGKVAFGLYASEEYIDRNGVPTCTADIANHSIIESVGEIADFVQARALRDLADGANVTLCTNTLASQTQAVVNGMGITTLPSYVASTQPNLIRVLQTEFNIELDIWLLTHKELRFTARIRAVIEYLKEKVLEDRDLLTGA